MKKYLRPDEIAFDLDVSKRTVYRLIEDGELLGFSVRDKGAIRIPVESYAAYKKRRLEKKQEEVGISDKCDTSASELIDTVVDSEKK